MIERRWIEQLDSADVQNRKIAVQQLARSRDMEAIRYLEATETGDADASVRDLARKAIVFIKRASEEAAAQASSPIIADEPAPTIVPEKPMEFAPVPPPQTPKEKFAAGSIISEYASKPPEPKPAPSDTPSGPTIMRIPVSPQREKAAKTAMGLAGRAAFEDQNGKAAKNLVEAFKLDPNLQYDTYAMGMASTITGLYKTDAVKAVLDGSILELFDKEELTGKPKKKNEDSAQPSAPPAGWGTAIVDLLIYGLIHAVLVGVTAIISIQIILSTMQNDPNFQAQLATNQMTLSSIVDQLAGVAILSLIVYALFYGLLVMVSLLVQSFFIHIVARMMLGGDGTMANLIHQTSLFLGVMTVVVALVQVIGNFLLPVLVDPGIIFIMGIVSFGLTLYTISGFSSRIGKAYDMSGSKGCLALFLSAILMTIIAFVCVFALIQATGMTLNTMVLTMTAVP